MEMPTPCNNCGEIFDLHDGRVSPRTMNRSPRIVICESCAFKEDEEIEREEEIQNLKDQISDAEYSLKAARERLEELGVPEDASSLLSTQEGARLLRWPTECPITKRPFFMKIEHPVFGDVPTFGGPYDSYMIPNVDYDGDLRCEHYDHDRGQWIEGGEPLAIYLTTAQPDDKDLPVFVERRRKANERTSNYKGAEIHRVHLS